MSLRALVTPLLAVPLFALPAGAVASAPAAADPCASPTIVGTAGDDRLTGTPGRDVIDGRGGDDVLEGRGGNDVLCGGDGADKLSGGAGDDRLYGERDRPRTQGGRSHEGDRLDGGPGDDVLHGGPDPRASRSYDRLTFEGAPRPVRVDLGTGRATGYGSDRIVSPVFQVVGSDHADRLLGTGRPEMLLGLDGADVIRGGGGDDVLAAGAQRPDGFRPTDRGNLVVGGPGDDEVLGGGPGDRLLGGAGNDVLRGLGSRALLAGPGNDIFSDHLAGRDGQVIDGGPGLDDGGLSSPDVWRRSPAHKVVTGRIDLASATGRYDTRTRTVRWELTATEALSVHATGRWTLLGTTGDDDLNLTGPVLSGLLVGREGDDLLDGTPRTDDIRGGPGYDIADGYGEPDRLTSVEEVRMPPEQERR
jgi:Ca2+-binding RTX toxin-like protein